MFADQVVVICRAGDGGNGCMSFRRETHVPRGGPNGGDGGGGGDVIVKADMQVNSLANIVGHKHWTAERGKHGEGSLKTGKCGKDEIILVPPGTIVRDAKRGNILRDLKEDQEIIIVAKGGKGGKGNKRFATATNRTPREFEEGGIGESREVLLELKLIADVGLIGKPNAGKSTLLSRLTRARPEIADYPFTTKSPNLGLVQVGYEEQFVMADIPGLIEGAHAGVGLGHEFLRHVERTKILVHLVEPMPSDQTDPFENYHQIRNEMIMYDPELGKRPEVVVVTKAELPDAEPLREVLENDLKRKVLKISSVTGESLAVLTREILNTLATVKVDE